MTYKAQAVDKIWCIVLLELQNVFHVTSIVL
jgi:hypothetical protein